MTLTDLPIYKHPIRPGPDVAIWERLRDSAKRNRRDIRTEALFIIEQSLTIEPEVYS